MPKPPRPAEPGKPAKPGIGTNTTNPGRHCDKDTQYRK